LPHTFNEGALGTNETSRTSKTNGIKRERLIVIICSLSPYSPECPDKAKDSSEYFLCLFVAIPCILLFCWSNVEIFITNTAANVPALLLSTAVPTF
jgi:hypothetical protein